MAVRTNLVNLDAMIKREDFATFDSDQPTFETVDKISIRDFTKGGLMGPSLRKPDFQRETNHWNPEQVVSLLECFVNGDLIPSVILWQSQTHLFVIDGGHRLSVLKAWVEDDYGDGPLSQAFFGNQISEGQKLIAKRTRDLVNKKVGIWKHFEDKINRTDIDASERKFLNTAVSRGIPIQWIKGNPEKAEASFFKINTKGTPLDDVEELLLKNRKKPVPISARAIIRAGKGHRYWSFFQEENARIIEELAGKLHATLFDPEVKSPVKTLDLPMGGPKGVRDALQVLINVILIANGAESVDRNKGKEYPDDIDGVSTISTLRKVLSLARRITGNDGGSLGLHPAVYFYGPTGRHSGPMFMGTLALIAEKLSNNNSKFFQDFTAVRQDLENLLIREKDLIATILQKQPSKRRVDSYKKLLDEIIILLNIGAKVSDEELVKLSGLDGKIVIGAPKTTSDTFSDDVKSEVFIRSALSTALKCPICNGYIDPNKSVSYDHVVRKREGGVGSSENCQLTHPYCNQSHKG